MSKKQETSTYTAQTLNTSLGSSVSRRQVENQSRKITDYQLLRVIGTGTFGKVYLATLGRDVVALKALKKTQIIELKQIDHIKLEKSILSQIYHPFIVNLHESFKDKTHVYLAFEYVQGGEIFRLLRRENLFPNDVALFYITEIVTALEYLHSLKIAYRDIKPENLLIAADGHLRITDFGFAKQVEDRTFTLCGTPEYLAPEIIMSIGHNHCVDWWALGILLFEMLAGYPPFYDQNPYEVYRKITIGHFEFPAQISMNGRKLINGLLEHDISKRLGCMKGGAVEIQQHSWFRGVDWSMVKAKKIQPPWVPELDSSTDFQYFDEYPDSGQPIMTPSNEQQKLFNDF